MIHHSSFTKLILVSLLASGLLAAKADTFFSDTFGSGSTVNQSPTTNISTTATSYQTLAGGAATSSIAANALGLTFPTGTSILGEVMGLFTNSPMSLNVAGDTIAITVVFTNKQNILSGVASANASINIGLFNSGNVSPNQGNIVLGNSVNMTGGSQNWIGYAARIFTNGNATIFTRPVQTSGKTQDQDLLFTGASSTTAFNNPGGTSLGSTAGTVTLAQGGTYTLYFSITLTGANALQITNTLYSGVGTGGSVLFTQTKAASGGTYLTSSFNGFAVGWRNSSASTQVSAITISSITVSGNITGGGTPSITTQPDAVTVSTGGSVPFSVVATGAGLTYQWHRNGTNLLNAGNISGATSSTLIISPVSAADVATGANGYYVTVTSAGVYSTNSITNSLSLISPTALVYSGSGPWDLKTSASWQDTNGNTGLFFNYGDSVTFDDIGGGGLVTLNGSYLSASSVKVNHTAGFYTFQGSGSFAGAGSLIYSGSAQLTVNNANTYTGGTIISNATANLRLQNLSGLGTGPVTLAKAGSKLEVLTSGSATAGIQGDVVLQDDATIQFDGVGAFAGVLLANLTGGAGKTLTLDQPDTTTTNRYRVYGANTALTGNLVLNGAATSQAIYSGTVLAPYNGSGSQTYSGVISGNGGLVQRGAGTTVLAGANTYSGGTFPTTGTIALGADSTGSVTSGPLGTGPLFVVPEVPNATGSGTVLAFGAARSVANPIQYPSATNNQTLIIGGSNQLTFSGSIALQGQDGLGTINNRIFQVANTAPTIFSGVISDGGSVFGITKTGAGALYLDGVNTFTGLSTNSAGRLAGSGSLAGSIVVNTTNATVGGGNTSGIGTLTVSGSVNLISGGGYVRVNRSGLASDKVSVTGGLTNSGTGTITITNLGATLQAGDVFTLFNKPVVGGNTLIVIGGAGVVWTNKLALNGTVEVLPNVNTASTNLVAVVNAGKLELSWPADHTGWRLQAQTNALTSGLGTNWVNIPGTDASNRYTNTFDTSKGAVFYRMVYP